MQSTENPTRSSSEAGELADEAKRALDREMTDAKTRASSAADSLRTSVQEASGTVTEALSDQAERRKHDAAGGLRSFASSIQRAAEADGQQNALAGRVAREVAQSLERISDGIERNSVSEMARAAMSYGRENPATFLTGCLIAGLAVGRLLTASSHRPEDRYAYDRGEGYGGAARGAASYGGADFGAGAAGTGHAGAFPAAGQPGAFPEPGADLATAAGASVMGERPDDGMPFGGGSSMPAGSGLGSGSGSGMGSSAAGLAGTYAGGVSSAERAPGDLDALGTQMDEGMPSLNDDIDAQGDPGDSFPAPQGLGRGGRDDI